MRYCNYHKHDHISSIFGMPDSAETQEAYVKRCVELGHTSYFTTNHGSMGDIFEAKTLCDQYGLHCKAGIEGYIVPDPLAKDRSNYHIVIIPQTNVARKKLNVINSRANIEGYYYRPRIFPEDLLALNPDDVYITTACEAGILRDDIAIEQIFLPLYEHFGDNLFLEVQNHQTDNQKRINEMCIRFSELYGLRIVAANDSHYVDETGQRKRTELLKGKRISYGDEDTYVLDFPDYDTFFSRFQKQGILSDEQIREAIDNTLIFELCEDIDINKEIKMPTIYPELSPRERYELLERMVYDRFKEVREEDLIPDDQVSKYIDGIRHELKIVEDTNEIVHTADYFLFNTKNVNLAVNKYHGVLTRGGRGSCASFYINRLLGMTQLDRFQINLPIFPERFASAARLLENRALPDIDFNVETQEPFVTASRELLGEHGCYPMIAYGTMQLGEAFRNVCRSHGLQFADFNEIAKHLETHREDKKWKDLIAEAEEYVGVIVSASVHPCAHILDNKDLLAEYGVVRIGDNICVMITSSEADEYKVLKNDYLIVKVWKLIHETFELVGKPIIPAKQLLDDIKDDERIWDLFKNGITCTLNQVDSDNGKQQAKRYNLHSFEEGAFLAAAIRPAFDSWRDGFLARRKYTTGSKELDGVLNQTGGYILFQECLMKYFEWLGVTPATSIGLIKKISKKKIKPEDFSNLEETLRENWEKQTGSDENFEETWELIQSCMSYGFASPHAAATSLDMCYGAWLKVHYPLEYYTVCFNNYFDDEERTKKLTNELKYFGIKISNIKFGFTQADYSFDRATRTIYKGTASAKYIGKKVSKELFELSERRKFRKFTDILFALNETSLNSRQLDLLIKVDFFSDFGNQRELLMIADFFQNTLKNGEAKKINRVNVDGTNLESLVRKFSSWHTKSGEEAKAYTIIDIVGLVNTYEDMVHDAHLDDLDDLVKVRNFKEVMGYIGYVSNKEEDRPKLYILDVYPIKRKKDGKQFGYSVVTKSIGSGIETRFTVFNKVFDENPVKEDDIILATGWERDGQYFRLTRYTRL